VGNLESALAGRPRRAAIELPTEPLAVTLKRQARRVPRKPRSSSMAGNSPLPRSTRPQTASPAGSTREGYTRATAWRSSSRTAPVRDRILRSAQGGGRQRLPQPHAQGDRAPPRVRGLGGAVPRHLRPRVGGWSRPFVTGQASRPSPSRPTATSCRRRRRSPYRPPSSSRQGRAPGRGFFRDRTPRDAAGCAEAPRPRRHRPPPVHVGTTGVPKGAEITTATSSRTASSSALHPLHRG